MNETKHEFKAEIQQLLQILVHSLYMDRDIFLRELISNAADALNRLQFEMLTNRDVLDPEAELVIRVTVDKEGRTITVSDTGIGMTREELIENLGTIAQSGAAAFVDRLETLDQTERPSLEMIGQFGVGFYSSFMVAEEVRVVSRSYLPEAVACQWKSDGSASFAVDLIPEGKSERGTDVIVKLREDALEFADDWRVRQIVKKHSDFVSFPIYAGDEVVNRQRPLWRESPQEIAPEEYDEFYKHLTFDSEGAILSTHLVADAPVHIRSIVYVPSRRERGPFHQSTEHGLRLYAKGVMIQQRNKELLPTHLRFVEGMIESEDLPLNISRETVQRNAAVRRVRKALASRLIRELTELATEKPDEYQRFWIEFGLFLKEGVATEPEAKEDLIPLLRFRCSEPSDTEKDAAFISLQEYVEGMHPDQPAIYYLLGEDPKSIASSPHLDYFRAIGTNVLYLVDPIDSFLVVALTEFGGKPLRNVDDASLELPEKGDQEPAEGEPIPQSDFNLLVARFTQVLGDRITEVRESRVLRDSPCRLVNPENVPGQEMHRVMRLLNREFQIPSRILEINRHHSLIRNLVHLISSSPSDPVIDPAIEQLFENQLIVEGIHPNPAGMVSRIQQLIEAATTPKA